MIIASGWDYSPYLDGHREYPIKESKDHLRTTELPALHKRMEDIRLGTAKLEWRRMSLLEKIAKAAH